MAVRSPKRTRRALRIAEESPRVRERILVAFSSKAKRSGIRAVVMGELASDLRMSAMTLYKHFASKDELGIRFFREALRKSATPKAPTLMDFFG